MSSTKKVRVHRVADWAGWCSPCADEARPLVLTRTGPAGPFAWLAGLGDDDRSLLLTCNVCGHWQVVPPCEEDDPEVVLDEREAALEVVTAACTATPGLPAPRVAVSTVVAEVVATVAVPDPGRAAVPAAVPAPRRPAVVLPQTVPAYSPEAVAAAARVLSAARAQTQRTAPRSAAERPAPLDRSRRTRSAAAGRRTDRPAVARVPRAAAPAVATSIVLPALTASQLVVATAH